MGKPVEIVFVCTGNICRSPMAEVIATAHADNAGLSGRVRFSSCGTGSWHIGHGADARALNELAAAGYDGSAHRAAKLGEHHKKADLLIALDRGHRNYLIEAQIPVEKIRLLRSFDPDATEADVADPYYGTAAEFRTARKNIEAAIPGLLDWIRENTTPSA